MLSLPLLVGCTLNRGPALAADFEEDWAGTSDVAEIDTVNNNTLPFVGTAVGTLILEDGTSNDRVVELAYELVEYIADHDGVGGEISVDGITFSVAANEKRTGEVLELWRSLAADDRVASGVIDTGSEHGSRSGVEITAVDGTAAMTVFNDMVADTDPYRPFSAGTTNLEVGTVQEVRPSLSVETGFDGDVPAEAIAAYEAVAAQYSVVTAFLTSERASIVVAEGTDLDHAGELARSAAPNLTDLTVTVEGDN